jgi:hypothetical protein
MLGHTRPLFCLLLLALLLPARISRAENVFYHAQNNTDLKSVTVPPGTAKMSVMRDGFAAAGDGGAALYTFNGSANCPSADDGAQVQPGSGTGCWYATLDGLVDVRVWGVPMDGSTNARPALQAAIRVHFQLRRQREH